MAVIDNNDEEEFLLKIMEKALKVFFPRASIHLGFHNRFEEGWRTIKGKCTKSLLNVIRTIFGLLIK